MLSPYQPYVIGPSQGLPRSLIVKYSSRGLSSIWMMKMQRRATKQWTSAPASGILKGKPIGRMNVRASR
jgi:hypothetical protein